MGDLALFGVVSADLDGFVSFGVLAGEAGSNSFAASAGSMVRFAWAVVSLSNARRSFESCRRRKKKN